MAGYQPITFRKLADKTTGRRESRLVVPMEAAVAVEDEDGRTMLVVDPADGERILHDPDTPGFEHTPWPLAGLRIEGGGTSVENAPHRTILPTKTVKRMISEGLVVGEGERVEHYPGGPPDDEWRTTHTFLHYDALVFKTVDGDVRYRVVGLPCKDADGEVRHVYRLEREDGPAGG